MWQFWLAFKALEPTVQLGGIFANKPGYHNTRTNLPASDYSVGQYAADRLGPADKAAAIDLTFPDAQRGNYSTIRKYASRLLASGRDMADERGNYLREFYGQADTDNFVEGWDFQSVEDATSDSSHLWHIHISVMRQNLNDPKCFRSLLSILKGETVAAWRAAEAALVAPKPTTPTVTPAPAPTPKPVVKPVVKPNPPVLRRAWPRYMPAGHYFGLISGPAASHGGHYASERPDVVAIQRRLIALGYAPTKSLTWASGQYGPQTKAAVAAWQRAKFGKVTTRFGEVWRDDWLRLFTY